MSSKDIMIPRHMIINVAKKKIFIIFSGMELNGVLLIFILTGFNAYVHINITRIAISIIINDTFVIICLSITKAAIVNMTININRTAYNSSLVFLSDVLGMWTKSIYFESLIPIIPNMNAEFKKLTKYLTPINMLIECVSGYNM